MANDPLRVLGLPAGATGSDIKRAYRALVKANHPDSAGERALPRFLAIQAAYEQLMAPGRRSTGRSRSAPTAPEAWRPEPGRARESSRSARSDGPFRTGSTSPGGRRPADHATGREERTAPSGTTGAGSAGGTGGAGSAREGGSSRSGASSPGAKSSSAGGTSRRRSTRKATFGSTTYDEAHASADPAWQGAAWYGQSSGEYWTVNPREYADPRKHGPEYQARAAERSARANARANARDAATAATAPPAGEPASSSRGNAAEAKPFASRADDPRGGGFSRPQTGTQTRDQSEDTARDQDDGLTEVVFQRQANDWAHRGGDVRPAFEAHGGRPRAGAGGPGPLSILAARLDRSRYRRIALAVLAWPPLGIAAASVIGQVTGCAAFAASCTRDGQILPWVAQVLILLALIALPGVARPLVAGTAAVAVLAFPAAAALSAGGATYDRTYGPASLIAILGLGWLAGVALGTARTLRMRSPT